ncbi:hypothetical protein Poli38472_007092 [Pythium oligandrum]|uniref:PX domain-containing protein n=1 Tax=Pythium oligandrum TaxID=41045 RepID=A0A8K1CAM4_PYTOL|nr:hypothetical protein Poli38472_007092 [Pythium oligandrum]|eukprot:TMW58947.1 hypothetical protein Poli38472_007092 [Pythium oligandrum]
MTHAFPLNILECTVVHTRKTNGHTDYGIRVQPRIGNGWDDRLFVYRRYSAFVELQRLALQHFHQDDDTPHQPGSCCCGTEACLFACFVEPVFRATEFSTTLALFFRRNSASVVTQRVVYLNAFLKMLDEAIADVPPLVLQRCEQENCKLLRLLKSFYGCVAAPRASASPVQRPQRSRSV